MRMMMKRMARAFHNYRNLPFRLVTLVMLVIYH